MPLKILRLVWPGKNKSFCRRNPTTCFIKVATCLPSGNSNGQKGAKTHDGTIRVPSAFVVSACLSKHGTRCTGRHHQLFSPPQLHVNVSTASVLEYQYQELNLTSWQFWTSANLSMVWRPHLLSSSLNTLGLTFSHRSLPTY